jgi:dipeptidyl aminopeptidase/acylaminoacyl peptidase
MSAEMLAVYKVPRLLGSAPLDRDNSENPEAGLFRFPPDEGGISRVVRFDAELKPIGGAALPADPTSMAAAPDASRVAMGVTEGKDAGLYVVPLTEGAEGGKIFPKAAEQPAFSPDGARIAFASDGDIYTIPVGGGDAVNLTKGEGSNSRPVWSPQAPKAK